MARVTVGVPVYNGAPMLRECLDCLLSQTFQDISIVISDNASTDETPEICAEYAAKDSRIRVVRHPENMTVLPNYKFLVDSCDTEYFMWRADDDYSDLNYIEELVSTLDADPKAILAVPRITTSHRPGEFLDEVSFDRIEASSLAERVLARLYCYHVSGYYGLWRTKYIQATSTRIWSAFAEAYACDHLTMLAAFLDDGVVGNNSTLFIQRTYSPAKGDGLRGKISLDFRIKRMEKLLPLFYSCFDAEVKRVGFSTAEEKMLLRQRRRYTAQKLRASPFRICRLKLKRFFASTRRLVLGTSRG